MVQMHRAVGIDVNEGARLIEIGVGEGNAEFHRRQRQAFFQHDIGGIETRDLLAAGPVVRRCFKLLDDLQRDVVLDRHAIRRHIAAVRVQIDLPDIQRIDPGLHRDGLDHAFGEDHALGAAEAAERGVRHRVGHQPPRADARRRVIISIIGVEHGAVADRVAQIRRVATTRQEFHIDTLDAALVVETGAIIDPKIMALAGHHHVFVAIKPALGGSAGHMSRQRRQAGPLRRLTLFAAEAPAQAAAFGGDAGTRHMQHVGDEMLNFGWVLGGTMHQHATLLLGHRETCLTLEIEMLLTANPEALFNHVGGRRQGLLHIALHEGIGFAHIPGLHGNRIFDRHGGLGRSDGDIRQSRGAAGLLARDSNNGENHLAMKDNVAIGENGIATNRRAAFVGARNVLRRQNRDNARCVSNRIEIKPGDAAYGNIAREAGVHMQQAFGLAHVVDIDGIALHMQASAVVGNWLTDGAGFDATPCLNHHATAWRWPVTRVAADVPATSSSAFFNRPCATSMR